MHADIKPGPGRARRILLRLALATVPVLVLILPAELVLRTRVPHCGVTPFRVSATPGLTSELRPSFETLYKGHEIRINSDGYRGPELPPREEGVLRVALVGDSFTFGNAVAWGDTLGVRLAQALGGAQVLNLGVPGYTAEHVAAVVQHDALALEPDVVVYVFYANDLDEPPGPHEIPPDSVIDGMHGFPAHSALVQWLNVQVKRLALAWFDLQLARRTPGWSRHQWQNGGGERVRAALESMRAACAAAGARLVVAGYPHLTRVGNNPFRPIDEAAAELCAELGIEWVDLLDAFEGERDLMRYWASAFDSHPNGEANARVAAFLAPRLRAQ